MVSGIIERVREVALRRLLFLPHAIRQMSRPDRIVTPAEVEAVVAMGDLVEDYPEDVRGHSCPFWASEMEADPFTWYARPGRTTWQ